MESSDAETDTACGVSDVGIVGVNDTNGVPVSRAVIEGAAHAGYRVLMTSEPTARTTRCHGMIVLGRYTIWSTTPAQRAAEYAAGSRRARARLWTEWTAKKVPKTIAPSVYQALRRVRARRA